MVRRIRYCSSCQRRFISKASTDLACSQCCSSTAASAAGAAAAAVAPDFDTPINSAERNSQPFSGESARRKVRCSQSDEHHSTKRPRTAVTTPPLSSAAASSSSSSGSRGNNIVIPEVTPRSNSNSDGHQVSPKTNDHPTITSNSSASSSSPLLLLPAAKQQEIISEICDDDSSQASISEKSGVSEGMDDFLCTQICSDNDTYEDADDGEEENHHNWGITTNASSNSNTEYYKAGTLDNELKLSTENSITDNQDLSECSTTKFPTVSNAAVATEPTSATGTTNPMDDENSCFICGSSFARITSGLNGRLQHIKRCAKKHNITARDIRMNDDDEAFVSATTETDVSEKTAAQTNKSTSGSLGEHENDSHKKPAAAVVNPYRKWHGDAEEDLKLASAISAPTPTLGMSAIVPAAAAQQQPGNTTKQTALTNFFKAPMRSLNNVLVSNAKRVAKTVGLNAQPRAKAPGNQQGAKGKKRGGWGARRDPKKCPDFKRIPGTDFICDGFTFASKSLTENYWLTHFHSDHYGGILKGWDCGTIFCSLPTANLVHERLGVAREFLHPLGLNTPVVVESKGRPITVTLFDANHCPGAVMFLFQVGKRTILHVGDFRWHREQMLRNAPLKALSQKNPQQLDDLFLDTTYCNERYNLPSQDVAIKVAIEYAVREVEQAKQKKERLLLIFGAYTIGKERMFLSVAERLGLKVYVDSQRFKVLSALEWPKERLAMLTTKKDESNLWVVPMGHINMKRMPPYVYNLSQAKFPVQKWDRVCGFRPTGWSHSRKPGKSIISTRTQGRLTIHSVPYSEHSAFPELVDCIRTLKPKKITPTVSVSKSQQQVDLLLRNVNIKQRTLLDNTAID